MSAKAMRTLSLLLALLPVVSQAAAVMSDTVMCWKIRGECSFLMRPTGTCYGGLGKCCRPLW
uniref:Beta-defensin-like domain-containing protein n=1 Tax=Dromaius novaehollandiae TaxID=8790 RepID=A0A8C4K6G3_DRONO